MPGSDQSIIMHHVTQGVDKVIQNQVQTQKLVGFCGDVLGIDRTVFLADLVGKSQYQRSGTRRWIVHRYITDLTLYHNSGYDGSDGMGCVVFGVLAGIFIVVIDEIFKNLCKEIIFLLKHLCKIKLYQLIDDGTAEQGLFCALNDILGDRLKQLDFFLAASLNGKNVQIKVSNVHQCIIKKFSDKFIYEAQRAEPSLARADHIEEALNAMPDDQYEMLLMMLGGDTAKLKSSDGN